MKRLFATAVLGVALAIILATLGQAWIMRGLIRSDGDTDLAAMRPPASEATRLQNERWASRWSEPVPSLPTARVACISST